MGTVAEDKDGERAPAESSGLSDIMEVAASLGIEESEDHDNDHDALEEVDEIETAGLVASVAAAPGPAEAANRIEPLAKKIPATEVEPVKPSPPIIPPTIAPEAKPATSAATAKPATSVEEREERAAEAAAAAALAGSRPSAPVSVSAASTPRPSSAEPKNNNGLWIAAAAVALLGIGWYAMRDNSPPPKVANTEVRSAASASERKPEPPPKVEPRPAPKVEAPPPPEPEPEPEEVVEPPPEPQAEEKVDVSVKKGRAKKGAEEPAAEKSAPGAKAPPSGPAEDPFADPKEIDERHRKECVLDPSKPGCGEILRKSRAAADLDSALADKLTAQQIREGFSSAKGKAKACGSQHAIEPGTTVRVKVSISGDSGEVLSAEALAPHDSLPAGKCVADALKSATFQRFGSAQQGTTYPVQF